MSAVAAPSARTRWRRALHHGHRISAAVALAGMLLFAATGLTLNHAAQIEARPAVVERKAVLPRALLAAQAPRPGDTRRHDPLPAPIADWVAGALDVDVRGRSAEWLPDELDVALPRPGGDASLRIDRASGEIVLEDTDRGWIAYLNDLHKGRDTGAAWRWFIDVLAAACVVFTVTGLLILHLHAGNRPGTWPLVGLGVVLPLLLALLFIH